MIFQVWSFTNGFMRVLQLSVRRKHKEEVDTARIHKVQVQNKINGEAE
ncbi:hypothetical protein HanRHA438_Chr07g0323681 [Helianthus annuus]|uniref:Uncharacterized protein n=1 Tax=Helianthus annuus TaxID=4232 RepID=A0A9K3I0X9_HELAN|nr:hypothetical protein HanXRQr2_Chr14g0661921 [Helianthus annuus]KAF5787904.1 hypothetical protein HanXRQr2_Chr10g0458091 [Helianthus annuus]KAJ0661260.1 hypothetical protein HanOQP8_Chr14g0546641 [Helianthus annuus]KAJ0841862.1 hypothetical protein HanPSC8_Chr14g0635191 [Helianthus annuus]KAJ0855412.1 hypothetical protein HanRHA438_Chr14g0673081 [Helianthus annuus]